MLCNIISCDEIGVNTLDDKYVQYLTTRSQQVYKSSADPISLCHLHQEEYQTLYFNMKCNEQTLRSLDLSTHQYEFKSFTSSIMDEVKNTFDNVCNYLQTNQTRGIGRPFCKWEDLLASRLTDYILRHQNEIKQYIEASIILEKSILYRTQIQNNIKDEHQHDGHIYAIKVYQNRCQDYKRRVQVYQIVLEQLIKKYNFN